MGVVLSKILKSISQVLKLARKPYPSVPAQLLYCDSQNRSGLSAISLGSSIIARLPEIGIPNGPNADGSENLVNKFVMLLAEEIVNEIKTNGLAMVALPPSTLDIVGTGMTTTGPVEITAKNVNITSLRGLLA